MDLIPFPSLGILPYCILGLLVMAEGPIATLIGGAAASSGALLPLPTYLSVVIGNLTADMGWYTLGRMCKLSWIQRIGPKLGIDLRQIERLEQRVQRYAPRLLFLAKLTVGFPIPTLVATGLSRVPVRRWAGMLVLGEMIKSAAIILAGYFYAQALQQASQGVQIVLLITTGLILAAGFFWFRRKKKLQQPGA